MARAAAAEKALWAVKTVPAKARRQAPEEVWDIKRRLPWVVMRMRGLTEEGIGGVDLSRMLAANANHSYLR
jgi:hypothetical protein